MNSLSHWNLSKGNKKKYVCMKNMYEFPQSKTKKQKKTGDSSKLTSHSSLILVSL